MAKFIPETLSVLPNAIRRHVSRVLRLLPDEYVVRQPVQHTDWPVDLIVEGQGSSWLNIVFLQDDKQDALRERCTKVSERFNMLARGCQEITGQALQVQILVVVWKAKTDKVIPYVSGQTKMNIVGKQFFLDNGISLICKNCITFTSSNFAWLLRTVLPEREIPAACTTRTIHLSDNSTQLTSYFLDYDQELAAKLDLFEVESETQVDQPVRLINGVAGSGKTLIIVSRILMYCTKYPDRKVLLLIHNKPVTADLMHRIEKHWGGFPDNLEVKTFWKWCRAQWTNIHGKRRLTILWNGDTTIKSFIGEIQGDFSLERFTETQLQEEIDFINDHMILTEETYLDASRAGRGFALRTEERSNMWRLYETVTAEFDQLGGCMSSLIPNQLYRHDPFKGAALDRYDHILVDEAQFFAPSWFELVKRCLRGTGSLFMCADPNQGFLKSRLSWKSAGINVRGRTKVLRKSYRTTQQILHAANAFLAEMLPQSGEDYIQPVYENMAQGPVPKLLYKSTAQDCLDQLVKEVEALINLGLPPQQIMVLYTTGVYPSHIEKRLEVAVGRSSIWNFSKKDGESVPCKQQSGFLKIAKVEAATGLESGIVFILGVDQIFSSFENLDLSDEERDEKRQEAARKMYMAMTRAGQRLVMFATSRVSTALEKSVDVQGVPDI